MIASHEFQPDPARVGTYADECHIPDRGMDARQCGASRRIYWLGSKTSRVSGDKPSSLTRNIRPPIIPRRVRAAVSRGQYAPARAIS